MKTKEVLIPVPKMAIKVSDNMVEQLYTVHVIDENGIVGPPTRFRVKSNIVDTVTHPSATQMGLGSNPN